MSRLFCNKTKYRSVKGSFLKNAAVSVGIFGVVLVAFLLGISKTSSKTDDEQEKLLETAVERSVVQCYVTEGRYPESIEYLEQNYGIRYDKEKYRIDYRAFGTNMMPEIDIIELEK